MTSDNQPYIIEFGTIGSESVGFISVAESPKIPFNAARTHWTYATPDDSIRGNHAHKNLRQILIAVSGTIYIDTESSEGVKQMFTLSSPDKGLYVPACCWITVRLGKNGVLLCLASEIFDERDYIRDHHTFKAYCRERA